MKPPLTILKELNSDLNHGVSSWINRLDALVIFASSNLENVIQGIEDDYTSYEQRLTARDEEIAALEAQNKNLLNLLAANHIVVLPSATVSSDEMEKLRREAASFYV